MKSEEKEVPLRGAQYPAYRGSKGASFCLTQGLRIQRMRREAHRATEERRGLFTLSEAQKLAGNFAPSGA